MRDSITDPEIMYEYPNTGRVRRPTLCKLIFIHHGVLIDQPHFAAWPLSRICIRPND